MLQNRSTSGTTVAQQHPCESTSKRADIASGIVDTCSLLKLCARGGKSGKSDSSIEGFTPYVTSKVLIELDNLLSSAKLEGFRRPYFLLKKLKVINDKRRDIKEEALRLCQTYNLDSSPNKVHSYDDSDWYLVAAAKLENQPIITEDRKLQQMAEKEGVYAAPVSVLRNLMKRAKKLDNCIQENHDQLNIEKPKLVKCLVCGHEVESGPAFQAHFMENHSPGKDKKPENLREHVTKKDKKQTHAKGSLWRVISHTTCTNICSQDSTYKHGHRNKQVTVTEFSNGNPQSNELTLVETQMKEDGAIVRIYRPLGGL
jgi:rRNA-processing protein FCF1